MSDCHHYTVTVEFTGTELDADVMFTAIADVVTDPPFDHMDPAVSSVRGPQAFDCQTCRERAELDLPIPCMACALDGRREEYEEMERDRRAGA